MRKLLYKGNNIFDIVEAADLEPGPDDIIISMKAASLCGSDLHIKDHHDYEFQKNPDYSPPVPGHEPAGIVQKVGQDVTGFMPGDRVVVYHKIGCGWCRYCRSGEIVHCIEGGAISTEFDGACADQMCVPARNCMHLPNSVSFEDGAILMCAGGTAYSGLKKLKLCAGETLAIFGCGPIGLTTLIFARAMGAKTICIDINDFRLGKAKELGADFCINSKEDSETAFSYSLIHGLQVPAHEVVRKIYDYTLGYGVECAAECSAALEARVNAVDSLRKHGRLVYLGISNQHRYGKGFQRSGEPDKIIFKELEIFGSNVFPLPMYYEIVDFMSNMGISLESLITHRFLLEEGSEAFAAAASQESGKVVIFWPEK